MFYDEVGSNGLPKAYVEALRAAGVEVSSFKPTQGSRNRFQLNFRNHRKMVVVDGVTGWVGGHNVGDEYLGLRSRDDPVARHPCSHRRSGRCCNFRSPSLSDWYWATRRIPDVNWTARGAQTADVTSAS